MCRDKHLMANRKTHVVNRLTTAKFERNLELSMSDMKNTAKAHGYRHLSDTTQLPNSMWNVTNRTAWLW